MRETFEERLRGQSENIDGMKKVRVEVNRGEFVFGDMVGFVFVFGEDVNKFQSLRRLLHRKLACPHPHVFRFSELAV